VDTVAPTFTVSLPPPPSRPTTDGFVHADPEPGGWANAWRRDQVVPVEVRVKDRNIGPEGISVALHGTDGTLAPAVGLSTFTEGCEAGTVCGVANLKLWEPALPAFRGSLRIHIQARDRAGHQTVSSDNSISNPESPDPVPEKLLPVTRWKWSFDARGTIYTTPALGERGTVYFGTQLSNLSTGDVASGALFAVAPEGKKKWEFARGGVYSSPTVGAPANGSEPVYVAVNEPGIKRVSLHALDGETGTVRYACPPESGGEEALGSMALLKTGDGNEAALVVLRDDINGRVRAIRPSALNQSERCVSYSIAVDPMPQGNLVIEGDTFTFATSDKTVARYRFRASNPSSTPLWQTGGNGSATFQAYTLAQQGTSLFGASAFGVFELPTQGAPAPTYLSGTQGLNLSGVLVGPGAVFFTGLDSNGRSLLGRHTREGFASTVQTNSNGALPQTPVLGRGGQLYGADSHAALAAFGADTLRYQWLTPLKLSVTGSLALDCTRDTGGAQVPGRPGILYVPAYNELRAVIVDSPALDSSAPWPKYQHDARNTGDSATPITNCQ